VDTSTMKYPFGRCASCGEEFNSELRNEYNITHCPWCGAEIDDFMSEKNIKRNAEHGGEIYCEECGVRIYERSEDGKGGNWIEDDKNNKCPGVCSGPCERELCGNCADWDVNGECEQCRTSPCGQCPNHGAIEACCKKCEHLPERKKWADYEEPDNPGKGERNGD